MWRGCRYGEYEYEKHEGSGTTARPREGAVHSSRWVCGSSCVGKRRARDECSEFGMESSGKRPPGKSLECAKSVAWSPGDSAASASSREVRGA